MQSASAKRRGADGSTVARTKKGTAGRPTYGPGERKRGVRLKKKAGGKDDEAAGKRSRVMGPYGKRRAPVDSQGNPLNASLQKCPEQTSDSGASVTTVYQSALAEQGALGDDDRVLSFVAGKGYAGAGGVHCCRDVSDVRVIKSYLLVSKSTSHSSHHPSPQETEIKFQQMLTVFMQSHLCFPEKKDWERAALLHAIFQFWGIADTTDRIEKINEQLRVAQV